LIKKKGEEHVTFQTFIRKLGYTDRNSAVSSYTLQLQASQIERQRSKRLVGDFTEFQNNSSELFWSEAVSKVDSIITARQAGAITRAAGLKQAADDFENYLGNFCATQCALLLTLSVQGLMVIGFKFVFPRRSGVVPSARKLVRVILAIPQSFRCR
jgi:hypothetical protein